MSDLPQMFSTPNLDPNIRPRVIRAAGLVYGFLVTLGFAVSFWGLDALQLQQVSAHLAWARLILGLAVCLPIGMFAGWLAGRSRWTGISILIWIAVAPLIILLAGHMPYEGLSWIAALNDPYPAGRWMYPFTPAAAVFAGQAMVIGAGFGLVIGLLQLFAADRAWNYSTAANRLGARSVLALCLCLPPAAAIGWIADAQINLPARGPVVDVGQAILTALDPNVDLRAARLPFLKDFRDDMTPRYTLYQLESPPNRESTSFDVVFDNGLIIRCTSAFGQVLPCSRAGRDLHEGMEQMMTFGHVACSGCAIQVDRAVRRWLTAVLPSMGALRELTLLQHQGGWLYQRATFDAGRAIDCRFRGSKPTVVDLCVESRNGR